MAPRTQIEHVIERFGTEVPIRPMVEVERLSLSRVSADSTSVPELHACFHLEVCPVIALEVLLVLSDGQSASISGLKISRFTFGKSVPAVGWVWLVHVFSCWLRFWQGRENAAIFGVGVRKGLNLLLLPPPLDTSDGVVFRVSACPRFPRALGALSQRGTNLECHEVPVLAMCYEESASN
jgi:hypothetical protein